MALNAEQRRNGQTIALAGILQATYLVDCIARNGSAPLESFYPSINSLFAFDVDGPEQVFGSLHGVDLGLRILQDVLAGNNSTEYRNAVRYALGVIHLQKQLSRKGELMTIIRNRLEHAAMKAEHFTEDPQSVTASIAAIYQDTLSTFKFRIQIAGSMQQLQNRDNADNIRALLLAGIRSAVLWRQMGGSRWQLLFARRKILHTARSLLTR